MTSQQRNWRPPTSTIAQTSSTGHETPDVAHPNIQHLEVSQRQSSVPEMPEQSSVARPTPADQAANAITQQQPDSQHSNSLHRIYNLLVSTVRPSLADRLERFNIASPTTSELSDFLRLIEQECLLRSIKPNARVTVSTGTIVQTALYLSGSLLQWSDPQSGRFRDLQLRALVAAFALLHHSGLTELTAEPYEELRLNIAARFNDIIDGRRASQMSLEDRMRKADALYLIRLAAQYFSLIKRAQPLSDAAPVPILGLVLAGASVAGGQYNGLSSAFRYADQVIGLIPGRKSRYLNLPAIQELTRNASTVLSLAETRDDDEIQVDSNQMAVEIVQLLQQLLKRNIRNIPSKKSRVWEWPLARLRRGPPLMDEWYFFYGLLDCLAQVARHIRHGTLSVELFSMLKYLMEESEYDELRWKILEIFEAYKPVRKNIHEWLKASHRGSNIDNAGILVDLTAVRVISGQQLITGSEAGSPISRQTTSSTAMDNFQSLSRDTTSSSQAMEGGPLYPALVAAQYNDRRPRTHPADVDAIERSSITHDSVLTSSTSGQGGSSSLTSQQQGNTPATEEEEDPEQYLEGSLQYWPQDGKGQESQLLPQGVLGRGLRGYAHAGLSTDCRLAFFSSSREVCVIRVSLEKRRRRKEDVIQEQKYDKKSPIADVSLLNDTLAVSTSRNLELFRIGQKDPAVVISHGEWEPLGIASWEQGSDAMIATGLRRGAGNSRSGRVVVYRFRLPALQRRILREFTLPKGTSPKFLSFDRDGKRLACITDRIVGNAVIVWKINEAPEDGGPAVITRHKHRPVRHYGGDETDSDGLTSVAMYDSPSQQPYVFCTTSASTERYRSEGEWAFSSPVAPPNEQVPPKSVHDLTALQDHRQLVAGTVSSKANKFAVLTKLGKILILSLSSHEEGGICSLNEEPDILPLSLCALRSSRATPTCIRFDPEGTKLHAVDPEGKFIVVMFRPEV
ncbi:MAG: hypothetical protein Q9169_005674 [Polycauliona sp. 2 TL-2023]